MTFKFSKKIIRTETDSLIRPIRVLRKYSITEGQKNIFAEFHQDHSKQFVSMDGDEIFIERRNKLIRKPEIYFVSRNTNGQIGEIKLKGNRISKRWESVVGEPNAIILYNEKSFHFGRIEPDIKSQFFKKHTWGHYKFVLYCIDNDQSAFYSFKIDVPFISSPFSTPFRPFEGVIETNFKDLLLLPLGFYLIELELEAEDRNDG